jgi:hypothetical protein
MKNKKIKFIASRGEPDFVKRLSFPIEAIKCLPDWYKDLSPYGGASNKLKDLGPTNDRGADGSNVSTKLCLPFFDAMTMGYMYCLEDDLSVELDKDGVPSLSWKSGIVLADKRPSVDMAIPLDCHPIQFGIRMNWFYETPKGYSILITHPFNRYDLPFYVSSAVVDSDIWGLPAFIPFFIKKNFFGVIPKGTPIFQMLPIKREPWQKEIILDEKNYAKNMISEERRRTNITGYYRKTTWQKKTYL